MSRFFFTCKCCGQKWTQEIADDQLCNGAADHFGAVRHPLIMIWDKDRKVFGYDVVCSAYDQRLMDTKACYPMTWMGMLAPVTARPLRWKPKADGKVTKCGSKCRSAKGPSCDCACHGEHHGEGS